MTDWNPYDLFDLITVSKQKDGASHFESPEKAVAIYVPTALQRPENTKFNTRWPVDFVVSRLYKVRAGTIDPSRQDDTSQL